MIRERRKTPKPERMAAKQDSVDEVDTTDLEGWFLRAKNWRKPSDDWQPTQRDIDFNLPQPEPEAFLDEQMVDQAMQELFVRHRIDVAKMLLGTEGGYSLRKFKRIFKREMAENPMLWKVFRPDEDREQQAKIAAATDDEQRVAAYDLGDFAKDLEVVDSEDWVSEDEEDATEALKAAEEELGAKFVDVTAMLAKEGEEFTEIELLESELPPLEEPEVPEEAEEAEFEVPEVDLEALRAELKEVLRAQVAEMNADSEEENLDLDED